MQRLRDASDVLSLPGQTREGTTRLELAALMGAGMWSGSGVEMGLLDLTLPGHARVHTM